MDFGTVYARLLAGDKVRRAIWRLLPNRPEAPGIYQWAYLYTEERPGHARALMVQRNDGRCSHFALIDEHLFADDWEVVPEPAPEDAQGEVVAKGWGGVRG